VINPCQRASARLAHEVDGVLPRFEAEALAAHLEECPDCRTTAAAYARLREVLTSAASHPAPQPPRIKALRARARRCGMAWEAPERPHSATRRVARPAALAAVAALVLASAGLGAGVATYTGGSTTTPVPAAVLAQVARPETVLFSYETRDRTPAPADTIVGDDFTSTPRLRPRFVSGPA
jgi:anti-sigma factor RsiW